MNLAISDLTAIDPGARAAFGGKACGLARLLGAGVPVPTGFAVGVTDRTPAAWSPRDRGVFVERAERLLARGAVAVRSSAAAEDGELASFAGQFATVLSVTSSGAALEAAGRCIESGASARVQAYAKAARLPVGVVCQEQVRAAAAGVCFTADPAGRDRGIVIESIRGLGEDLVSGHVAPDRCRVYLNGRGRWEVVREGAGTSLANVQAEEVAGTARWLAERLGQPLDLEWALDDAGRLWWLQARPITAARAYLPWTIESPSSTVDDGPITVWADWNVRETLPDPLTPLAWTLLRDRVSRDLLGAVGLSPDMPMYRHFQAFGRVAGRAYLNLNALLGASGARKGLYRALDLVDPQAGRMTERLVREGVVEPRPLPRAPWQNLRALVGMTGAHFGLLASLLRPGRTLAKLAEAGARLAEQRGRDLSGLTDAELLKELDTRTDSRSFATHVLMVVAGPLLLDCAKRHFADCPEVLKLLGAGNRNVPTTRITLAIERLVKAARPLAGQFEAGVPPAELKTDPRARAFNAQLAAFLAEFGQRGPGEMDVARPRWADDPSMILELVAAGLAAPAGESTAARMERLEAARAAAVAQAASRMSWWRGFKLKLIARWIERLMPLREAPKHFGLHGLALAREAFVEVGRRLAARGALPRANDVFFLELDELADALAGRIVDAPAVVEARQRQHAGWRECRPPAMLRSDGVPVLDPEARNRDPHVLAGAPASSGRVRGPARILAGPDPGAIRPGDVIVMRLADPGWTPLFPLAAGVVMEVGGVICHAAVVARELGVPAVFGVDGALERLEDGQLIEIDGDAGTVRMVRA